MCGIFCVLISDQCINSKQIASDLLNKYESIRTQICNRGPDYHSTVEVVLKDEHYFNFAASVLWLQGSTITQQPIETDTSVFAYNGDIFGGTLLPESIRHSHGDTELLLKSLEASRDLTMTLSNVQGPYSFIYLDKRTLKLYFGRDMYGRRSLVIGKKEDAFLISSVANKKMGFQCIELPAIGIFCYDLDSKQLSVFPWKFRHSNFTAQVKKLENLLNKTVLVNETNFNIVKHHSFIPPTEEDLLHFKQLDNVKSVREAFDSLLKHKHYVNRIKSLQVLLERAVEKRIATQPQFCHNCIKGRLQCNHALSGVLFSGGIDCAILALLCDKFTSTTRPIDLLNVAFKNDAPDRITALETLNELKQICPHRNWNFVDINVSEDELTAERSKCIADLIYPLNTILDDSLGCALWFASRGRSECYQSPCRVLLVGMGADELFGGYTKHRTALKRGGWTALHQSLEDDWQNISHRNLARDDRVVSDHGRQLRTPYLDEDVIEFVRKLNCWERTYPSEELPQGLGEKILLRGLGYYLGLTNAAGFKKRALQFGSRIANSKENANDRSPRL